MHGRPSSQRQRPGQRTSNSGKSSRAGAVLPPPPSQPDDVEHWTRAMYLDARR
jgi:hypothetical protein